MNRTTILSRNERIIIMEANYPIILVIYISLEVLGSIEIQVIPARFVLNDKFVGVFTFVLLQ